MKTLKVGFGPLVRARFGPVVLVTNEKGTVFVGVTTIDFIALTIYNRIQQVPPINNILLSEKVHSRFIEKDQGIAQTNTVISRQRHELYVIVKALYWTTGQVAIKADWE